MRIDKRIKVGISFAESAREFAGKLYALLEERGFSVVTDNHNVGNIIKKWGVHKILLIDEVVSGDVLFCIVLLTRDYANEKWTAYRRCRLLESSLERKGFLLPVMLGEQPIHLRGITEHLGEITVGINEPDKVLKFFVEKILGFPDEFGDQFRAGGDIAPILLQYNHKMDIEIIGSGEDRAKKIGYKVYRAVDILTRRITFFFHLYGGVNITATAQEVVMKFHGVFGSNPIIILLPREREQRQLQRRLENVRTAFSAQSAFYIDQFVWEMCTDPRFRQPQESFDLQHFVDPMLKAGTEGEGTGEWLAIEEMMNWFSRQSMPVLVIQGSGGIGKTTVAQAFANRLIEEGGRKILFIDDEQIIRYIDRRRDSIAFFDIYHAYKAYVESQEEAAENGDVLSEQLFKMAFENGKIVMILDGLDEVIARHATFPIMELMGSAYGYYGEDQAGKLIVTCRNHFLPLTEVDPNVITLELLPFSRKQATRFLEGHFPNLPKTVGKGLKMAGRLTNGEKESTEVEEGEFIPFVLDVVARILKSSVEEEDPFADPTFVSDCLVPEVGNDYIIGKICKRESIKYSQGLTAEEQVEFFVYLSVEREGVVPLEGLKERLTEILGVRSDETQSKAIVNHPLLFVSGNEVLRFNYDLLVPYFQSVGVSRVLNGLQKISASIARVLARRTEADPDFVLDCSARFHGSLEDLKMRMLDVIDDLGSLDLRSNVEKKRAISGIFTILIYRMRAQGALSRETATTLLKDMFGDGNVIRGWCFCGAKDPFIFDFSSLRLESCYLESYDEFWECRFDKATRFSGCELALLHLREGVSTEASRENFDLHSCSVDDTVTAVLERKASEVNHAKNVRVTDIEHILKLFYKHGHILPQKEAMLRARYKGRTPYSVLVGELRNCGILEVNSSYKVKVIGPEEKVVDKRKNDVLMFVTQGVVSSEIKKAINYGDE